MNSLKISAFFITIIACLSGSLDSLAQSGYTLNGHINGLAEGTKLTMNMMVYNPGAAVEVTRDSGVVKNGQFTIQGGFVPDGPRVYWLRFSSIGQIYIYRMLIDNNQDITISYDRDVNKAGFQLLDRFFTCDGSPTNTAYHLIWAMDDMFTYSNYAMNKQLEKIKESLGYDKPTVNIIMAAKKKFRDVFNANMLAQVQPNMKPAIAYFALYEGGDHDAIWNQVYNQLDEHQKSSVFGKKLKDRLPLLEGQQMPTFELPDTNGKTVSLKNIVDKGKLTLVRFWATESVERPQFDKELRALYKNYHEKGLNMIAISTDSYTEQWKKTLKKENYPWQNLVDLKGQKFVDPIYHELGEVDHQNTTNVLIDANGRIVAWDTSGIELQWLLDQYLSAN